MADLAKRKAAAERARKRRAERANLPDRTCADCGAKVPVSDRAHDPVRCGPCLEAYNLQNRERAGYKPDGRAA